MIILHESPPSFVFSSVILKQKGRRSNTDGHIIIVVCTTDILWGPSRVVVVLSKLWSLLDPRIQRRLTTVTLRVSTSTWPPWRVSINLLSFGSLSKIIFPDKIDSLSCPMNETDVLWQKKGTIVSSIRYVSSGDTSI